MAGSRVRPRARPSQRSLMPGPLAGVKIVELAGIGPGPFCAMMLADMGADVVRVDRAQNVTGGDPAAPPADVLNRGRRSLGVDLKNTDGVEPVLSLIESAAALLEGFRPGVMERLGLGPDVALARNPKLVYGRLTGWGQEGPYAPTAGHDINYIALRSEEHTSELQSLMRISYAVFCLKKKKTTKTHIRPVDLLQKLLRTT